MRKKARTALNTLKGRTKKARAMSMTHKTRGIPTMIKAKKRKPSMVCVLSNPKKRMQPVS